MRIWSYKQPKIGEKREVVKFAWLPTKIYSNFKDREDSSGDTIWLQPHIKYQKFVQKKNYKNKYGIKTEIRYWLTYKMKAIEEK